MNDGDPRRAAPVAAAAVVAVMAASVVLAAGGAPQAAYADDFVVDAQCVGDVWFATIYDADYGGAWAERALPDTRVMTIPSAGSTNVVSAFATDAKGMLLLEPENNTGWAWISKPGYNDKKVRTWCSTAYDRLFHSEQFASYCYDHAYGTLPATYLPAIDGLYDASVHSIVEFFDSQIVRQNGIIEGQIREIENLTSVIRAYNGTYTYHGISNDTKDRLCLASLKEMTSMGYEALGMMHFSRLGVLDGDTLLHQREALLENLGALAAAMPSCTYGAHGLGDDAVAELEALAALTSELERQATLQEEAGQAEPQAPPQAPQHPPAQSGRPAQQGYYYYGNDYYAGDGRYPYSYNSNNDRNGLYHYDPAGSGQYDYGRHSAGENYDPAEHEDHDHVHRCVTFCDSSEYEPGWARYLDKHGARDACWDVESDPDRIGTDDWYWCKDLERFLYRY